MIPHKTARGAAALERLKLYEGMPPPFDRQKKVVIPAALRALRLKPGRKYCTVSLRTDVADQLAEAAHGAGTHALTPAQIKRISHEGYKDVVDKLEAKRKVKGEAFHAQRKAAVKKQAQAATNAGSAIAEVNQRLAVYGL
jgi:large subunit ribosomal protein L13Ae